MMVRIEGPSMLLAPILLLCSANPQDHAGEPSAPVATESPWETSLSTYWIEPPHTYGYLSAVVTADKGPLHLEAHWAYEDRDTLSIFAGRNFPIEGDIHGSFTPRLGLAGGDSDGIVPAANLGLGWKSLHFSTDVEYLIGTSNETSDFLYSWNEFTYALSDRFTIGLVGQRTNIFDQDLTVDRGLLFGMSFAKAYVTAYVFNPDRDDPYVTLAVGAGF
jgi:hypothetical protein